MGVVAGDLWSAFVSGPSTATRGPGLSTTSDSSPSSSSTWVLGVGLLGAGVVALGAATGVGVRRSRVRLNNTPR